MENKKQQTFKGAKPDEKLFLDIGSFIFAHKRYSVFMRKRDLKRNWRNIKVVLNGNGLKANFYLAWSDAEFRFSETRDYKIISSNDAYGKVFIKNILDIILAQ